MLHFGHHLHDCKLIEDMLFLLFLANVVFRQHLKGKKLLCVLSLREADIAKSPLA